MGYAKRKSTASAASRPPSASTVAPTEAKPAKRKDSGSIWNMQIGGEKRKTDMKRVEVFTKSTITIALNKPVQNEFILPDGRKFEFECGELLSFAVPPGLFTLEDGTKVTFSGWTLKRRVGMSWEVVRCESSRQIEFVCGEDDLRLELEFARQGLVLLLK